MKESYIILGMFSIAAQLWWQQWIAVSSLINQVRNPKLIIYLNFLSTLKFVTA